MMVMVCCHGVVIGEGEIVKGCGVMVCGWGTWQHLVGTRQDGS